MMLKPSDTAPATTNFVIQVKALAKVFPVYEKPGDRLKQFLMPKLRFLASDQPRQYHREFWALREVSFTVRRGEVVGIIGRNGAGKSTLLQIISGTLSSTSGQVETRGRIAALLELGSGFNPEFTGRENVYLNGTILGLCTAEIDLRFAEIAAFADIGDFIDQPVKTYSSGMYVRLAFAVQACIDPEILIVDEALSVGDIGFQYKCFKRMEALRDKGTTILIVTHSTGSVLEYADRCIVLDAGRVVQDTTDVLSAVLTYEKGMLPSRAPQLSSAGTGRLDAPSSMAELKAVQLRVSNVELGERRFGSGRAIIRSLEILKADGTLFDDQPVVKTGEGIVFRFYIAASEHIANVVLGVSLSKQQGADIWGDNNLGAGHPLDISPGECVVEYQVRLPISSGEYLVHCGLACFAGDRREELDQRRPIAKLRFWSPRTQVGVVHAPIQVFVSAGEGR